MYLKDNYFDVTIRLTFDQEINTHVSLLMKEYIQSDKRLLKLFVFLNNWQNIHQKPVFGEHLDQ